MTNTFARLAVTAVVLVAMSCSGSASAPDPCPEGVPRQRSNGGISAETREEAVQGWFESEGLPSTSEAVSAGVIAAEPGPEPGTEVVVVASPGGTPEVTITLEALDPGWGVASATWCEPVG
jgi:hypothetical protein